jgi:hypothetical protein
MNESAELAILDLAKVLKVQASSIHLLRVQSDEFPADNLGCLGPGVTPVPIPAVVSGTLIVLEVEGKQYVYHARASQVIFCGPWE